jgi:hypothetical protein
MGTFLMILGWSFAIIFAICASIAGNTLTGVGLYVLSGSFVIMSGITGMMDVISQAVRSRSGA